MGRRLVLSRILTKCNGWDSQQENHKNPRRQHTLIIWVPQCSFLLKSFSPNLWITSPWKNSFLLSMRLYRKIINNGLTLYIYKLVKLATVIEGDQKAPFSIATTPRCRGRHYSFPWIAPLYPLPYIAEC